MPHKVYLFVFIRCPVDNNLGSTTVSLNVAPALECAIHLWHLMFSLIAGGDCVTNKTPAHFWVDCGSTL